MIEIKNHVVLKCHTLFKNLGIQIMKETFKSIGKFIESNFAQHQGKYFFFGTIVIPTGTFFIGRYLSDQEQKEESKQQQILNLQKSLDKMQLYQTKVGGEVTKIHNHILKQTNFNKLKTTDHQYKNLLECLESQIDHTNFRACIDESNFYVKLSGNQEGE